MVVCGGGGWSSGGIFWICTLGFFCILKGGKGYRVVLVACFLGFLGIFGDWEFGFGFGVWGLGGVGLVDG